MSHASIDTCSRRDFSSFSRGPHEHRCVASVDRTCAAHEPAHVAHVGSVTDTCVAHEPAHVAHVEGVTDTCAAHEPAHVWRTWKV